MRKYSALSKNNLSLVSHDSVCHFMSVNPQQYKLLGVAHHFHLQTAYWKELRRQIIHSKMKYLCRGKIIHIKNKH